MPRKTSASRKSRKVHDDLFRAMIADLRLAETLLRIMLPEDVTERAIWKTLTAVRESFRAPSGRGKNADAVFYLILKGNPRRAILILLEHKCRGDWGIAMQVADYRWVIWHDAARAQFEIPPCAVFAGVVLQSRRGWKSDGAIRVDLKGCDYTVTSDQAALREFVLLDLSEQREKLHGIDMHAVDRGGLIAMANYGDANPSEKNMDGMVAGLVEGSYTYDMLRDYIFEVLELDRRALEESFKRVWKEDGKMMTVADQFRAEGIAEGEARGEAKGKISVLLDLMQTRFGDVPDKVRTKVEKAKSEDIASWTRSMMYADRIEKVFDGSLLKS